MTMKRVGSILHGALGDYYEQLLCLRLFTEKNPHVTLVVFFAVENRIRAYQHFDLSFIDEIYLADKIADIHVDEFYQFQIHDQELNENILNHLPPTVKDLFDYKNVNLPWLILKEHNFSEKPLYLELSSRGKEYFKFAKEINEIDDTVFETRFTVGFLWRYRQKGSINSKGQFPVRIIKHHLNKLFKELTRNYDSHILICGMRKGELEASPKYEEIVKEAGLALGERRNTFTNYRFDIDPSRSTYLKGVGYAAEMYIMSQCDLLITMPSGFSEPLWMMQKQPVIIIFPPFEYLLRLWKWNMPFFDHNRWSGRWYNTFTLHSAGNVLNYLKKRDYLSRATK
ncbi:hypothetical protein GF337_03200 [candidate division KSB1 bacterium]|nr:hypothetical protein [candidate division KSB1 bacterium]